MDVELARTFLAIVGTRSFVRAADQLNVSQTTVSARIRTLEDELGRQLFVRNRNGAHLTPAGREAQIRPGRRIPAGTSAGRQADPGTPRHRSRPGAPARCTWDNSRYRRD